jgi:hypothetical protein
MVKAAELHNLPRIASDTRIRVERSGKAAFKLADPKMLPTRQIPLPMSNPDMPLHLPYLSAMNSERKTAGASTDTPKKKFTYRFPPKLSPRA